MRERRWGWKIGWLVAMLAMGCPPAGAAADKAKSGASTVLKSEDGLRFQLPADWPIEKHGSVVRPIPVEEYLSKKFEAMDARMRALEQQMTSLELRLRAVEEENKKQQGLKSVGTSP